MQVRGKLPSPLVMLPLRRKTRLMFHLYTTAWAAQATRFCVHQPHKGKMGDRSAIMSSTMLGGSPKPQGPSGKAWTTYNSWALGSPPLIYGGLPGLSDSM